VSQQGLRDMLSDEHASHHRATLRDIRDVLSGAQLSHHRAAPITIGDQSRSVSNTLSNTMQALVDSTKAGCIRKEALPRYVYFPFAVNSS
jgi:hypothetical protein